MQYRKLGRTGLEVSALGLGCSGLGGVFGDMPEQDAIRTVHTAFDLGINYLDTAPLYGFTKSEAVVGKALRGIARDRYFISSKVGRYSFNDSDFSYGRVKQGLEESLGRLGCEYLDIAILHDIEFVPLEVVLNEGLRAVLDARQEGKVRFIGASGLPLKIFPAILAYANLDVVISYAHFTLQNTSLLSMLPLFEAHGTGVINASPLALGLLTPAGPPKWHLAPDEMKAKCRDAAAWCASRGIDIAELGMRFALSEPRIHSTLSGAVSPQEVEHNVRAAGEPPDPELVSAVQNILSPVRDLTWPSGRPEYN
jgi:aryl-alcohol dehydrogenase-like predicted oxidoreductase